MLPPSCLFCVVSLRDGPTGMFAPRGQESSLLGQLCPPAPSTGLEARQMLANKCGRKGGIFSLSFLGITESLSIHPQIARTEMTEIQISRLADDAKLGHRTNDK